MLVLGMKVQEIASALRDPTPARDLLKLILLIANWEASKSCSLDAIILACRSSLLEVYSIYALRSFFFSLSVIFILFFYMQFVHDISILDEGLSGFSRLSQSLKDEAQAVVARVKVAEELL